MNYKFNKNFTDVPYDNIDDIGFKDVTNALLELIQKCETPFTISLQGDWGSGKTSIMKSIQNMLRTKIGEGFTIWFNAWEFSQFDMDKNLSILLMNKIINDITKGRKDLEKIGKEILSSKVFSILESKTGINFKLIINSSYTELKKFNNLKNELEKIVKEKLNDGQRLYFFIDDLDRLDPIKAVNLLETLKTFFDIKNCIFIIAIDYNVVKIGIEDKYNGKLNDKEKQFFDKFFQLPILIPDGGKIIDNYIEKSFDEQPIFQNINELKPEIVALIKISSNNNIRSAKKIINSIIFSFGLYNEKNEFKQYLYLLIPIVCMKLIYPNFYSVIKNASKSEKLDDIFHESLKTDRIDDTLKDYNISDDNALKEFISKLLLILRKTDVYEQFCKLIIEDKNLFIAESIVNNHSDDFDIFIKNCKNECRQLIEDVNNGIKGTKKGSFDFDLSAYNLRKHCVNIAWQEENKDGDTSFYIALSLKYCNSYNKFKPSIQISKNRTKKEIESDLPKSKELYDIYDKEDLIDIQFKYNKIASMSTIAFKFNDTFSFDECDKWNDLQQSIKKELIRLINICV